MQNEVMQQGGTRQGRASTDGAASVITRAEAMAYELTIQEVMTGKIKAVTPDLPMVDVLDLMREARVTGAPVVVDGDLVGIVSVVAVGALLELSAVIITENATPDEGTIAKANQEGVTLLSTHESTFHVIGTLWELGLRDR
jgi:signal-transduction protein with cAMP-binding, CBS, and nucleotidyltransferase domain